MSFTIHEEIGMRLCELRERDKDKNLKQKDLADLLGITPAAYGKLELGTRRLSPEYCITLADFYGVSCDYILRGMPTEYLDICKETCLNSNTLNVLQEREKETRALTEKYNQAIASAKKLNREIQRYAEILSEKEFQDLHLWPEYRECEDQRIKAFYDLAGSSGVEYLINAFIQNKRLQGGLKRACIKINQDAYSHFRHMINDADDTDYYASLDAAKYTAGQAFAEFFSSLCESADFFREITTLDDKLIQVAIERGLLHE